MNFNTKAAKARVARIQAFTRDNPATTAQIAADLRMSKYTAWRYIEHMKGSGALITDRMESRQGFYKSTGVYHPEMLQITGSEAVRKAPYVKPFRCEWTSLFFGPATDSGQKQENHA